MMIPKEEIILRRQDLEVTANMVEPSFIPSKSKKKQPADSSEESDADWSPGLKDILIEPEVAY